MIRREARGAGQPTDSDEIAWLRLALAPEVGPALAHRLLESFGSPQAIFEVSTYQIGEIEGAGRKRVDSLLAQETCDRARREIEEAKRLGIRILTLDSADYPENLKATPRPPLVLYLHGELRAGDRLGLAVVGPRKPSDYGRQMTQTLIPPLCARGLTIVSGLAYGIDAEAHRTAIECGGRTLAVVAHGLDVPTSPSANRPLARRMVEEQRGALISVFPFGTSPDARLFPQRNAIIAALSLGTLVIEAGEASGALITAGCSADLGRTVMACPGDATRPNARGANRLIVEGAALVQKSDDVLEALASELRQAREGLPAEVHKGLPEGGQDPESFQGGGSGGLKPRQAVDALETRLREMLSEDHRTIDYLLDGCAEAGFTQSEVIQKLLIMELGGLLRQLPGRVYCLTGCP